MHVSAMNKKCAHVYSEQKCAHVCSEHILHMSAVNKIVHMPAEYLGNVCFSATFQYLPPANSTLLWESGFAKCCPFLFTFLAEKVQNIAVNVLQYFRGQLFCENITLLLFIDQYTVSSTPSFLAK